MNALKGVAGVDEDLFVISDEVIEPICDLKTSTLHAKNPRLHSDETLLALSVSSATDPIAKQLVDAADQLRGCDAFFSVILSPTDEKLYRTLGINICCEPKYEQLPQVGLNYIVAWRSQPRYSRPARWFAGRFCLGKRSRAAKRIRIRESSRVFAVSYAMQVISADRLPNPYFTWCVSAFPFGLMFTSVFPIYAD